MPLTRVVRAQFNILQQREIAQFASHPLGSGSSSQHTAGRPRSSVHPGPKFVKRRPYLSVAEPAVIRSDHVLHYEKPFGAGGRCPRIVVVHHPGGHRLIAGRV
jgi:hypothetical protein